jgi:hypothetical protein
MPISSVRESIPPRRYVSHVALVSSIYIPSGSLEERCDILMEDDAKIDFKYAANGIVIEYKDTVDGFFQIEKVAHDVTLASRFSRDC